ncbi:MAG: adenylate/guanylate cyclase domain-containing protein [Saprospiraceae bacterium]
MPNHNYPICFRKLGILNILVCLAFYGTNLTSLAAQNTQLIDSLRSQLSNAVKDTSEVIILNDLAWELKVAAPEEALKLLQNAVQLSNQLNYPKGEAQAYNNQGVVEAIRGNFELATEHYQKALVLRQQLNDQKGVASLYNNIGNLQESLGNYEEALDNYNQSLQLRELLKDSLRIGRTSYNISLLYEAIGNYPRALGFIFKHLEMSERLGDKYEIAQAYNQIGNIKFELERWEEALSFYQKALELRKTLGDEYELAFAYNSMGIITDQLGESKFEASTLDTAFSRSQEALAYFSQALTIYRSLDDQESIAAAYNNIGLVHKNRGSYFLSQTQKTKAADSFVEALDYLEQSLKIRQGLNDQKGIMEVYNGIGDVKRRQQKIAEALQYCKAYLAIAEKIKDQKFIQKAYKDLSRIYAEQQKFKLAYDFRKQYDELRYQRLNEKRIKDNERMEITYSDGKKQEAIKRQRQALQLQAIELKQANTLRNSLIGGAFALLLLAGLLYNRYRLKNQANIELEQKNRIIDTERKRSDKLLLNILPSQTAEELKKFGKAKAKRHDSVSVLFTDFKSFTKITAQLNPEALVAELDKCFQAFDDITSKWGIEKIKTIGDAYMCAGGLPTSNTTHAQDVVQAALEIQQFMQNLKIENTKRGLVAFECRIGIHTGPVVAGIVGSKKFAYDIWGETVNLAAHLESAGEVGKVNISPTTYELVKDLYQCTPRGKIAVKNSAAIEMYYVEG